MTTTLGGPTIAPLAELATDGLPVPVTDGYVSYANLDYAASAPCLEAVRDAIDTALPYYSSVHRGAGYASQVTTDRYERARQTVRSFVGAWRRDAVVFTRNTTDAMNLLAHALPAGTSTVVFESEHHATLLPWKRATRLPFRSRPTAVATAGGGTRRLPRRTPALVVTAASNVTGELWPRRRTGRHRPSPRRQDRGRRRPARAAPPVRHGRARPRLRGLLRAQAVRAVRGRLPGRPRRLAARRRALPARWRGDGRRRDDHVTWSTDPEQRHEAGTPNVLGTVALAAACRALDSLPAGAVEGHERLLHRRLVDGLVGLGIDPLRVWRDHDDVVGLATFTVDGVDAETVAAYLSAEHGVGVRDGRFCAHPLLARLGASAGAVRASIGVGTSSDDVDALVTGLAQLLSDGPSWRYKRVDGAVVPVPDPRQLPAWAGPAGPGSPCRPTH